MPHGRCAPRGAAPACGTGTKTSLRDAHLGLMAWKTPCAHPRVTTRFSARSSDKARREAGAQTATRPSSFRAHILPPGSGPLATERFVPGGSQRSHERWRRRQEQVGGVRARGPSSRPRAVFRTWCGDPPGGVSLVTKSLAGVSQETCGVG